jgi:hypothetical protein
MSSFNHMDWETAARVLQEHSVTALALSTQLTIFVHPDTTAPKEPSKPMPVRLGRTDL